MQPAQLFHHISKRLHAEEHQFKFASMGAALFFALSLWGAFQHEMWRDEAQAWMIAQASSTPLDLWKNLSQEGHPPLWHFLLWILTSINAPIFSMQVLHSLIATSAAYIVLRTSPFHWLEKIAFCFGYYLFYEWNLVARNYNGGVTLLLITMSQFDKWDSPRFKDAWKFYLPLAFSGLFNVYALAVAFGVCALVAAQALFKRRLPNWPGVLCVALISIFSAWSIARANLGPVQTSPFSSTFFSERSYESAKYIYKNIHAISSAGWWEEYSFSGLIRIGEEIFPPVFFFALLTFLIWKPSIFIFYVTALAATLVVLVGVRTAGFRHSGHLFLISFMAMWLAMALGKAEQSIKSRTLLPARIAFAGCLALQWLAGWVAFKRDVEMPFSAAHEAASLIQQHAKENGWDDYQLASFTDWSGTPVAAYLGKKIFNPLTGREEHFVPWQQRLGFSNTDALARISNFVQAAEKPVYVILNIPQPMPPPFIFMGQTQQGIIRDEQFKLYYLPK